MKDLIQWDGVHAIRNICNKASDPNRATLYTGTQGAGLCRQRRTEEQNVSSFQSYTPRQAIQPSNTYTRDSGALLPFRHPAPETLQGSALDCTDLPDMPAQPTVPQRPEACALGRPARGPAGEPGRSQTTTALAKHSPPHSSPPFPDDQGGMRG